MSEVYSMEEYNRLYADREPMAAAEGLSLLTYAPNKRDKVVHGFYYSAQLEDSARVTGIMGPLGSGKTTALLARPVWETIYKIPAVWDPALERWVKRSRYYVVRETYTQMSTTILKTFLELIEELSGSVVKTRGEDPITYMLDRDFVDFSQVTEDMKESDYPLVRLQIEYVFFAIGNKTPEECFKSVNITGAIVNECLISERHFTYLQGRIGRYPKEISDGDSFGGSITCDFNPMDEDHWLMRSFIFAPKESHILFRQPPGVFLDPVTGQFEENINAENIDNLPPKYYENQINVYPDKNDRKMLLMNEPGRSHAGEAVYDGYYDERIHVAESELRPIKGRGILIYADCAFHPAALIMQKLPNGQTAVLDEIFGINMGPEEFGKNLMALLREKYPWAAEEPELVHCGCDPAGEQGKDHNMDWVRIMKAVTGFRWRPITKGNNSINLRLDSVKLLLQSRVDKRPALVISPNCAKLREGFRTKYLYKEVPNVSLGEVIYEDKPSKNHPWSDLHDSLQYFALDAGFADEAQGKKRGNRKRSIVSDLKHKVKSARKRYYRR